MATYDTLLLVLVAPVMWWLLAMVRAVLDVRAREVPMSEWDSIEDVNPYA